jgi:DNA-binding PadR family transcriptional regulator
MTKRSTAKKSQTRSLCLDAIILGLLLEEPMHGYRMRKSIEEKGLDQVANVRKLASIYQALKRLMSLGLIEVRQAAQSDSHPERVVYSITDLGRESGVAWLTRMLATFGASFPEFPAAISLLSMLPPDELRKEFAARARAIGNELSKLNAKRQDAGPWAKLLRALGEYRIALLEAELTWADTVMEHLMSASIASAGKRRRDAVSNAAPGPAKSR